jgi:hypothetical protein
MPWDFGSGGGLWPNGVLRAVPTAKISPDAEYGPEPSFGNIGVHCDMELPPFHDEALGADQFRQGFQTPAGFSASLSDSRHPHFIDWLTGIPVTARFSASL